MDAVGDDGRHAHHSQSTGPRSSGPVLSNIRSAKNAGKLWDASVRTFRV